MKALARAIAVCVAISLFLSGCGYDPATGATPTPEVTQAPTATPFPTPDGGLPTPEPLPTPTATPPSSYEFALVKNDAAEFGRGDLVIGDVAFGASLEEVLSSRLETPVSDETYTEGAQYRVIEFSSGDQYHFINDDGEYSLVQAANMNERLEGPRGIKVGDSMEKVLAAFKCDGEGETRQDGGATQHTLYFDADAAYSSKKQDVPFAYIRISEEYDLLGMTQKLSNAVQIIYELVPDCNCVFTIQDGTVALIEWNGKSITQE